MIYVNTIHMKSGKTITIKSTENICNKFAGERMEKDSYIRISDSGYDTWILSENIEFVETVAKG